MASYPSAIAIFTAKVNVTDIIDASHPNNIQDEVTAIESTLGTEPRLSTSPSSGGTYSNIATTYTTLKDRLANIEQGIVADTHTQYIRKTGDSANIVTAGSSSVKPLILKGASGQSVNLQEWQNNGSTVLAQVDQSGNIQAVSFVKTGGTSSQFLKADGSVDSNAYVTQLISTNAQLGSYSLALSDASKVVEISSSSSNTLTVPTDSIAFPTGSQIIILQTGLGQTTITGAGGVTVNATPGLKLRAQWSSATLIKRGSNLWVAIGDLVA